MQRISSDASLLLYYDHIAYSVAMFLAYLGENDPLTKSFQDKLTEWTAKFEAELASRRQKIVTQASVIANTTILDRQTIKAGDAVLLEVNRNRESLFYKRFFPINPSEINRMPTTEQATYVKLNVVRELEKLEETHVLKKYYTPLKAAAENTLAALNLRTEVHAQALMTDKEIDVWKESINNLRLLAYSDLLKKAVESGYPKSWVETFFYSPSKPSKSKKTDNEKAET